MFRLRNAAAVFTTLMLVSFSPLMASEADLKIPNLASQKFLGMDGRTLLMLGLGACSTLGGASGGVSAGINRSKGAGPQNQNSKKGREWDIGF